MAKRMLIDATHPEETRVVVLDGNRLDEFDFETSTKKQVKGNIYLAKVTRVEPSLQAAFVEFGGNRHGFLAFSEIHPDYYRIPIGDRPHRDAEPFEHEPPMETAPPPADNLGAPDAFGGTGALDLPLPDLAAPELPAPELPVPESAAPENAAPSFGWEAGPTQETQPCGTAGMSEPAHLSDTSDQPRVEGDAPATGEMGEARSLPEASHDETLTGPAPEGFVEGNGGESNAAEAASEMRRDTSMEATGEAQTVETVGGDEFEEAARQRSRSLRHYKIQEVVKRRQIMLVQVTKEERGNKGAALTTYLSLAGRYCVLMPNTGRGGGVSRKITSVADRRRLKEILEDLNLPDGMGVIVRTAGSERSKAEIKRDLEYLLRLWDEIRSLTLQSTAPALIYEEGNLIKRSIRDLYARDIDEVLVEGEEGYRTAKAFMKMLMPSHAKRVQPYRDPSIPLLHRFQIESQIDLIHSPVVQLRSGGYIVINPTEALVAIDVNSGRSTKERNIEETALRTNLEAAEEIARQLRLRDLAGLIVIDFIDMEEHRNQGAVERRLKEAMRHDRARIQLGRISPFGLLELSRQRLRPSLVEASTLPCPHCNGTGHIRSTESTALHVLRAIEEEGIRRRSAEICLYVPTNVALYILNQKRDALAQIELRYGFRVTLAKDDTLIPPAFRLERLRALTAAEAAAVPAAIAQAPPPVEIEEDEEVEAEIEEPSSPPAAAERSDEGGEDEHGHRRRRRRRRRRPGEEREPSGQHAAPAGAIEETGTTASDGGATAAPLEAVDATANEGPRDEGPREHVAPAGPGGAHDEDGGRRRRRRGKRGGRRRSRGDGATNGEAATPGEAALYSPWSSNSPEPNQIAADEVEIVHAEQGENDNVAAEEIAAAFVVSPMNLGEEKLGSASAPVADMPGDRPSYRDDELRHGVEPAVAASTSAGSPEPREAPRESVAETDTAERQIQPTEAGSSVADAKLITEKPANPRRGWWQRFLQP